VWRVGPQKVVDHVGLLRGHLARELWIAAVGLARANHVRLLLVHWLWRRCLERRHN